MRKKIENDTIILKLVQKGKIDAFGELVKKYTPHVYKLCKSKLSRKEDAEDLTQNAFISLYKSVDRLDTGKPVLPYLYMITRNELKMFYRKHKQEITLNDEMSEAIAAPLLNDDPSAQLVFRGISNEQKTTLQMVYDGYSYQEIAEKLQKPLNTVRTIIRRARLQIKKQQGT